MCVNPNKTAASLMAAIEPTIKLLLPFTGASADQQALVITEYEAALKAVQNWKQGTTADEVLQLIAAFQAGFNALPIPTEYIALANIILAGVETVIGILAANSPAPVAPEALTAHPEAQAMHAASVAADTTAKVQTLVPGFKRSIWHSPESQYAKAWNQTADSSGHPDLKV